MTKISLRLLTLTLIGILTYSCQKEEETSIEQAQVENEQIDLTGITKLGRKLENPYSVINMKKAWESLSRTSKVSKSGDIETTHLYIKFKPKTEEELDLLKRDSTLVLYDIPLDFEVEENGNFYHDPEVPLDQPTYQYTSISVNTQLPSGVAYEILEELFIPDEEGDYEETSKSFASKTTIDQLVDESLKLTGNLDENEIGSSLTAKSKWTPAGRIQVWDDKITGWIGVEGIEVRARRWFTTHKGKTDFYGKYSCNGRFRRDANYSIEWETYEYSIRSNGHGQASFNGPKRRGDWNMNFEDNSLQQFYSFIHLAAYRYYYKDIQGLKRPPTNSFWKTQMKISGMNENGRAFHNKDRRWLGINSRIYLYRYENNTNVSVERLYNTTFHELAHASHWEVRKGNWSSTEDKLKESYALGVAWMLTRLRYPSHNDYSNLTFNWIKTDGENKYTPLFIDLMDYQNQGIGNTIRAFDEVDGFTMQRLEYVLGRCKNLEELKVQLAYYFNSSNSTSTEINDLFVQYINLSR